MFKLFRVLIILLMFFQLCYCTNTSLLSHSEAIARVVNGRPAKLGDVPYQVAFKALYSKLQRLYITFCGGAIIKPNKVISAAHCFEEKHSLCRKFWSKSIKVSYRIVTRVFAVAGNLMNFAVYPNNDDSGQWRTIYSITYPSNYKFPRSDISIVITKNPFIYNDYVGPIPISSKFIDFNGKCLVSGYGRISPTVSSERLLLADLELISAAYCSAMHQTNMILFVCTSDLVSDVQKGDSGGPLVCQGTGDPNDKGHGVVFGIVSGNRLGVGSFFTRVSSYYRYIESKGCCKEIKYAYILLSIIYCKILLF